MNINENIKKARRAAGITQQELADMLGVYQKDISRWEHGTRTPNLEAFAGICKALKISADILLEIRTEEE